MEDSEKITAKDIKRGLFIKWARTSLHAVDNTYFFSKWFESDFIFVTTMGFIYEVEIKISKADFSKDFEKCFKVGDCGYEYSSKLKNPILQNHNKHDMIKSGAFGLKGFYFAISSDLVDKVKIPDYCGLIICKKIKNRVSNDYRVLCHIKKRAPKLPNPLKVTANQADDITTAIKWRYLNDRMSGI